MKRIVILLMFLVSAGLYAATYSPEYSCSDQCFYAGPNLTDKDLVCCDACKAERAN
jgi:hypothetical protein